MQKRSHRLLASTLLKNQYGLKAARRAPQFSKR